MKTILVLAMHGALPADFPMFELSEMMNLHNRLEQIHVIGQDESRNRYAELETKMREWPRNADNDPFYAGSISLAKHLEATSGLKVILGFNEFCSPSLDVALENAASEAGKVLVITPMMTRGGEHSEHDIPAAIQRARELHPDVIFQYAWPFDVSEVARFLSEQLKKLP